MPASETFTKYNRKTNGTNSITNLNYKSSSVQALAFLTNSAKVNHSEK
jgi:hypothetical protein